MMFRHWLARVIIPAVLIVGIGLLLMTRRPPPAVVSEGPSSGDRLHKIGLAIDDATSRLGHAPRNLDELMPSLRGEGDPDVLLVSPVDGLPYAIVFGVDARMTGTGTVLAYEQSATNGKRNVLTTTGVVQLTDAEFASAEFPPGHRSTARP
jgi:hypothetical protein